MLSPFSKTFFFSFRACFVVKLRGCSARGGGAPTDIDALNNCVGMTCLRRSSQTLRWLERIPEPFKAQGSVHSFFVFVFFILSTGQQQGKIPPQCISSQRDFAKSSSSNHGQPVAIVSRFFFFFFFKCHPNSLHTTYNFVVVSFVLGWRLFCSPYNLCREYFKRKNSGESERECFHLSAEIYFQKKGKWISFRYLPLSDRGNKWFDTNSKKARKKRSMIPPNFVDKTGKK